MLYKCNVAATRTEDSTTVVNTHGAGQELRLTPALAFGKPMPMA